MVREAVRLRRTFCPPGDTPKGLYSGMWLRAGRSVSVFLLVQEKYAEFASKKECWQYNSIFYIAGLFACREYLKFHRPTQDSRRTVTTYVFL